jgi:hypothetical protein
MCFHEPDGVSPLGWKGKSPPEAKIWSCSHCTHGFETHVTPNDGVTLSEVVRYSKLVILLACCSEHIIEEYDSVGGLSKPDFVVFWRPYITYDKSFYIFLALLITSIERRDVGFTNGLWHEIISCYGSSSMLSMQIHSGLSLAYTPNYHDRWHVWWLLNQRVHK